MTYKEFASWLEGVLDVNPDGLNEKQVEIIKSKIGTLTYPKETPHFGPGIPTPVNQVKLRC